MASLSQPPLLATPHNAIEPNILENTTARFVPSLSQVAVLERCRETLRANLVEKLKDLETEVAEATMITVLHQIERFIELQSNVADDTAPPIDTNSNVRLLYFAASSCERMLEYLGFRNLNELQQNKMSRADYREEWDVIKRLHQHLGIMRRAYWEQLKKTNC